MDTRGAPALPPRSSGRTVPRTGNYPPENSSLYASSGDPRRSSTQSLLPSQSHETERRKLLLVYIHGFMGTETSFRSFPAHVHNLVTITLADSHIVHTKIYPRYQARRTIDDVAEAFSRWLNPHEGPITDVVLLGHSMGGLVAAEIELLPATTITPGNTFRHRIIGTINFDVPFLGMHPSVVGTGIGSIFRPAPPSVDKPYDSDGGPLSTTSSLTADSVGSPGPSRQDTLFSAPSDPNFNPKFQNDVILPMRKGWQNAMHFMNKHSDNIRKATKQLVKSHVEFGGAMADYSSLRLRYMKVRALEDEDATIRKRLTDVPYAPARVRFINYYTASTGRKKKSRSRSRSPYGQLLDSTTALGTSTSHLNPSTQSLNSPSAPLSPRISVDEHIEGSVVHKGQITTGPEVPPMELEQLPPYAISEASVDEHSMEETYEDPAYAHIHVQMPNLPPLPPPPMKPMLLDLTVYPDPAAQELMRREHGRQMKAYEQALQDREAAVTDRKQLEDSLRKLAIQQEMKSKEPKMKENICEPKPAIGSTSALDATPTPTPLATADSRPPAVAGASYTTVDNDSPTTAASTFSIDREESRSVAPEATKRRKDRKFCALPKKNSRGERDPTWVRIFMEDMDEVSAHTGLFYMSETYEKLVGEVGAKIEDWVRDDMTRRLVEGYAE